MSIFGRLIAVFIFSGLSFSVYSNPTDSSGGQYDTLSNASASCNREKSVLNSPAPAGYGNRDYVCSYPSTYYGTNGFTLWSSSSHGQIWAYYYVSGSAGTLCASGTHINQVTSSCIAACVTPQVMDTRSGTYGQCLTPPTCKKYETLNSTSTACIAPTCISPQVNSTVTGGCIPPPGLVGLDCYNGKTVYVPSVCPVNPIDAIRADITPPNPGEIKTCKDGSQVTYPQSCFSKYTMDLAFQLMTMGSSKIAAKISDLVMTKGANGEYQLTTNWAAKIKDITSYSRDVTEIPRGVVADSVTAYSNAGKGFNVLADIVSRSSGDLTLTNNQIFPVGSSTPLTPNQILSAMEQYGSSLPPSVDMAPYIPLHEVLGLESSFVKLGKDWEAIQDSNPATVPELLPPTSIGTTPQFAASPAPVDWPAVQTDPMPHYWPSAVSPSPVPVDAPQSPNTFSPKDPVTGLPQAQPTATSPYTVNPDGTTPITVPNLENDKQPYFPWLLKTDYMGWQAINFFPALPTSGSCVYVIDYTFHVPLLGNKSIHIAPCDKLAPLRAILGWAFAVLTAFTIFFIVFRSTAQF